MILMKLRRQDRKEAKVSKFNLGEHGSIIGDLKLYSIHTLPDRSSNAMSFLATSLVDTCV